MNKFKKDDIIRAVNGDRVIDGLAGQLARVTETNVLLSTPRDVITVDWLTLKPGQHQNTHVYEDRFEKI